MRELALAPVVASMRMPRLLWEALGGNPFGPRESERMVAEKVMALHEMVFGLQIEGLKTLAALSGAMTRMEPIMPVIFESARTIIGASVAPASRRVKRNLRRLTE